MRAIRLRAVLDAPDVFNTTFAEYADWPEKRWAAQLVASSVFVAVENGFDVGMIRLTRDDCLDGMAWLVQLWVALLDVGNDNAPAIALYRSCGFVPNGRSSTMPPPREHVCEHQLERGLR